MAITVFGAGGIGGITGAALARAGHDVVLADQAFDEFDPATYRAAAGGDAGTIGRAMAAVTRHHRAHTKTKTGIWRDLAVRKRKTEVEAHLGGTIVRAERLGIRVPLTRRLLGLVGQLETGRRAMAWTNLDALGAAP